MFSSTARLHELMSQKHISARRSKNKVCAPPRRNGRPRVSWGLRFRRSGLLILSKNFLHKHISQLSGSPSRNSQGSSDRSLVELEQEIDRMLSEGVVEERLPGEPGGPTPPELQALWDAEMDGHPIPPGALQKIQQDWLHPPQEPVDAAENAGGPVYPGSIPGTVDEEMDWREERVEERQPRAPRHESGSWGWNSDDRGGAASHDAMRGSAAGARETRDRSPRRRYYDQRGGFEEGRHRLDEEDSYTDSESDSRSTSHGFGRQFSLEQDSKNVVEHIDLLGVIDFCSPVYGGMMFFDGAHETAEEDAANHPTDRQTVHSLFDVLPHTLARLRQAVPASGLPAGPTTPVSGVVGPGAVPAARPVSRAPSPAASSPASSAAPPESPHSAGGTALFADSRDHSPKRGEQGGKQEVQDPFLGERGGKQVAVGHNSFPVDASVRRSGSLASAADERSATLGTVLEERRGPPRTQSGGGGEATVLLEGTFDSREQHSSPKRGDEHGGQQVLQGAQHPSLVRPACRVDASVRRPGEVASGERRSSAPTVFDETGRERRLGDLDGPFFVMDETGRARRLGDLDAPVPDRYRKKRAKGFRQLSGICDRLAEREEQTLRAYGEGTVLG